MSGDARASGFTHTRSASTPTAPVTRIDAANVSGSARSAPPTPAALSPASTVSPVKAPSMKMSP